MKIKLSDLQSTTHKALLNYGYTESEANIIQKILLWAQVRGNNQGVVKLIGNGIPKRDGAASPKIAKETPVSALVDGNKTHAMITMDYMTDLAIDKAKQSGVGIAGNFNSSESTGAIGYYVEKIANAGFIGMSFASAPVKLAAPYGSNEAKFCTNPVAYGIPTESEPIVLDMATSTMGYYGLVEAKLAGKQVAEGMGYDSEGNETTDPAKIMDGALKTMAGQKGSGLSLVVQVLAGAFVNADSFNNSGNAGNLVIAIDPNIFDLDGNFRKRVSEIIKEVKSARKLPGVDEILVPGERGNRVRKQNIDSGEIEIEENLWKQLSEKAEEV